MNWGLRRLQPHSPGSSTNSKPKGLDYRFTLYPGENHNSVRLVAFPAGLYWVYRQPK